MAARLPQLEAAPQVPAARSETASFRPFSGMADAFLRHLMLRRLDLAPPSGSESFLFQPAISGKKPKISPAFRPSRCARPQNEGLWPHFFEEEGLCPQSP